MKRKYLYMFIMILSVFIITGCNNKIVKSDDNKIDNKNEVIKEVKVIINDKKYKIQLEVNDTVNEFIKLLPREFYMNELNGNEKYTYLDNSLPTNSINSDYINAGDVMLYGDNCLVVFYKSFNTTYSYTKIGHIVNMPNLDNKNIKIRFEK